jgi:hypothetical protein
MSEGEAVTCASRAAQTWVDKRLRDLHSVSRRKDSQRPVRVGAVQLQNRIVPHDAERLLSFESFKAQMAKSGLHVSAESLEKSYSALLALRKRNHYSWTQIRSKMAQARSRAAKTQGDRLPLTIHDWQRII